MSKRDIHIERLQIRMRGIDARRARAAVSDLGHELLNELGALDGMKGNVRISEVDAGTTQAGSGIAKQIARSIKAQRIGVHKRCLS
ncbi:MAG TPA: hypothetical protein VJ306_24445 [Pyrinomonadaceae bacterium]|nr:hypothetical protein [Pyrinomonadaceae bacterium]